MGQEPQPSPVLAKGITAAPQPALVTTVEADRHRSLLADRAIGVVCGFGGLSYQLGLEGLVAALERQAHGHN